MASLDEIIEQVMPRQDVWINRLYNASVKYLKNAMIIGAEYEAEKLGLDVTWDVKNPDVIEWINNYSQLMASRVYETLRDDIRKILVTGIDTGLPLTDIRMGIEQLLLDPAAGEYRAERIARTELLRANEAGGNQQAMELGAKEVVWRTASGECDFCAELDGKTIAVESEFFKQGDSVTLEDGRTLKLNYSDTPYPPLHPNCRCFTTYKYD